MSWIEYLLSFLIMFFRTEGTVILWSAKGVPYWQSFLFSVCWTSLTLAATYYGVGFLVNQLKKWWVLRVLIEKWQTEVVARKNNFSKKNSSYSKKIASWLSQKKRGVLIFLSFFPLTQLVYGLPSGVIAATKLIEIRYGILILLLGNAIRWFGITLLIYLGVQLFR